MSDLHIQLPPFASDAVSQTDCPVCGRRFAIGDSIGAGVRHSPEDNAHRFFVEVLCPGCEGKFWLAINTKVISPVLWPKELAAICGYSCHMDAPSQQEHPRFLTPAQPATGITLLKRGSSRCPYHIFGGYRLADEEGPVLLLFRIHNKNSRPLDGVLRLESRNRIRIAQLPDDEKLGADEWEAFLSMRERCLFKRRGRTWRKLKREEIAEMLRGRMFSFASLHRQTEKPSPPATIPPLPAKEPSLSIDERPVPHVVRVVQLMDAVPGNAPDENGVPILIMTLGHKGEIEEPIAMSLDDTKVLCTKTLHALTVHGNEVAAAIFNEYFTDAAEDDSFDSDDNEDEENR